MRSTVGALADAEPLLPLPPVPYPATITGTGPVDANASVAFRGARYSVPPGLHRRRCSPSATGWARPRSRSCRPRVPSSPSTGAPLGGLVRTSDHRAALEAVVLGASAPRRRACPRATTRRARPPGRGGRLRGTEEREVTVDLARYAELVEAAR